MRFGKLSLSFFVCIVASMAMMFVMPVSMILAAPATPVETGYEIPISELNKVKKKTPSKRSKESRKKNKSNVKPQESSSETAVQAAPAGKALTPPVEFKSAAQGETVHQETPTAAIPMAESDSIRIYHSPYSFVVAGKRSVIQAVVSSKTDIQEVKCILPADDGGVAAMVKMEKENGTRFTYTAILPAISQEKTALRYTIVAVDSMGREIRSKEFVTPLTLSTVLPSWQLIESLGETISVEQEVGKKPQKSISDPALPR